MKGERVEEVTTIEIWFLHNERVGGQSGSQCSCSFGFFFLAAWLHWLHVFDLKHSQGQAYPSMLADKNTLSFRKHIKMRMTTQARKLCKLAKKKIKTNVREFNNDDSKFSFSSREHYQSHEDSQSAIQGISQCGSTSRCAEIKWWLRKVNLRRRFHLMQANSTRGRSIQNS